LVVRTNSGKTLVSSKLRPGGDKDVNQGRKERKEGLRSEN